MKEIIKNILTTISDEKINKLTDQQTDFITLPLDNSYFLSACPGSGKTEVVGLKAAFEIKKWEESYSGIAVLSFTRNAAKEISERVSKYCGINFTSYPHYIGTIDSWLHNYILHPFGHKVFDYNGHGGDKSYRLVDNSEKYDFLTNFSTNIFENGKFKQNIFVNEYYFEYQGSCILQSQSKYLNLDNLTQSEKNNLSKNKRKFLKAGLSTYQDAEFLCFYTLFKNESILNNFAKRFPIIFVDECQDLSLNQLQILQLLKDKGVKLFLIGDLNQAIYEFRKVYIEDIIDYIKRNNFESKYLSENFRSNQKIVDVCQNIAKIISGGNEISDVTGIDRGKGDFIYLYEYNNLSELPDKFLEIIDHYNSSGIQEEYKVNINNSAILGRGYSLLNQIRPSINNKLNHVELFANALICWNLSNRTGKDMQTALQQLGKSIALLAFKGHGNHQQQYCPDGISAIEWRGFLFNVIEDASSKLFPFANKTWSEWINDNLKPFLKNNWESWFKGTSKWDDTKYLIRSPSGKASDKIIDSLSQPTANNSHAIRITTIHDVKGENLNAVMLVSSYENRGEKTGRHYSDWINETSTEKEFIRFAYVASSRPKHLLIWAVPKLTKENRNKLKSILNLTI